jgi:competence protein ComEC
MTILLLVSICFTSGIIAGEFILDNIFMSFASVLLIIPICFPKYCPPLLACLLAGLSAFSSGVNSVINEDSFLAQNFPQCIRVAEGTILEPAYHTKDFSRIKIDLFGMSDCISGLGSNTLKQKKGTLYIKINNNDPSNKGFIKGNKIITTGNIRRLTSYSTTSSTVESSEKENFAVNLSSNLDIIKQKATHSFFEPSLNELRSKITEFLEKAYVSHSPLARALVLGQSVAVPREQRELFRKTATSHLLALSGLHLGIFTLLIFGSLSYIFKRITFLSQRYQVTRFAALFSILPLLGFTLLTGASPPIVRSCTMCLAFLFSLILLRRSNSFNSLFACAVFLMQINSQIIKSPGFQLSFITVLALLVCISEKKNPEEKNSHAIIKKINKYADALFKTTFVAAGITSPIVALHFSTICPISPIINLVAVPLVTFFILPLLILSTVVGLFFTRAGILIGKVTDFILEILIRYLDYCSQIPPPFGSIEALPVWVTLFFSVFCFLIAFKKWFWSLVPLFLFAFGVLFCSFQVNFPKEKLVLDFISTGQGDSTLVTFPSGFHWLIDAGGTARFRIGKDYLVPLLQKKGVKKIEKLILTHPDPDHLNGMPDIVENFTISEIWDNGQGIEEESSPQYHNLLSIAKKKKVPIKRGKKLCKEFSIDGVQIKVFHPCNDELSYFPEFSFNNNSIVVFMKFNDIGILLPGDLSKDAEDLLLKKHHLPRSHILKIGHHGSKSSSSLDFLKAIKPLHAIASCARDNQYGFPHKTVLRNLKNQNIKLWRTDFHGTIRFIVDKKNNISIETKKNLEIPVLLE